MGLSQSNMLKDENVKVKKKKKRKKKHTFKNYKKTKKNRFFIARVHFFYI